MGGMVGIDPVTENSAFTGDPEDQRSAVLSIQLYFQKPFFNKANTPDRVAFRKKPFSLLEPPGKLIGANGRKRGGITVIQDGAAPDLTGNTIVSGYSHILWK
jgi:hypothetical protein